MNYEAHYHAARENERAASDAYYEALATERAASDERADAFRFMNACAATEYEAAFAVWEAARDAHERASEARATAFAIATFMYVRANEARDAYYATIR